MNHLVGFGLCSPSPIVFLNSAMLRDVALLETVTVTLNTWRMIAKNECQQQSFGSFCFLLSVHQSASDGKWRGAAS